MERFYYYDVMEVGNKKSVFVFCTNQVEGAWVFWKQVRKMILDKHCIPDRSSSSDVQIGSGLTTCDKL